MNKIRLLFFIAGLIIASGMTRPLWADDFNGSFRLVNPHTIVDQKGRTVVVAKPFARIISLYGAHTENLFALGAEDALIGVGTHETYPKEAKEKPAFSYRDGPEKFLAARPDLILIRPMIDRGYPQLFRQLEAQGIIVLSLQPGTVSEMWDYFRILGKVTGKEQAAARMIDVFNRSLAVIQTHYQDVPVKKRVYLESIHSRMKTFSPDSMAVFVLESVGGIHAGADAIPSRGTNIANYGKERILAQANDIDVYIAQQGKMNPVTIPMIEGEPGFNTIRAVKERHVYLIDEEMISRPSLRLLDGMVEMGRMIYPHHDSDTLFEKLGAMRRSLSEE